MAWTRFLLWMVGLTQLLRFYLRLLKGLRRGEEFLALNIPLGLFGR